MKNTEKLLAMMQGINLYRVTVKVEGNPDFTIEVKGDCEAFGRNSAQTHAMAVYPHRLRGKMVEYQVKQIS